MEQTKIDICLTENAQVIFQRLGFDPSAYTTGYGGESAGLDLYNMGEATVIPGRTKWSVYGEPNVAFNTGIRIRIPEGYVGLIKERGSIVKTGLASRAGVIDTGFTGEIFVTLTNLGEKDTQVATGAKLPVQLVVVPCVNKFNSVTFPEYMKRTGDAARRDGQVGSTDKQE